MFTPVPSLVGGLLLSYSTSALLVTQGRVLGCSGVAHSSIASAFSWLRGAPEGTQSSSKSDKKELGPAPAQANGWKVAALAGLVSGGVILRFLRPVLEGWTGDSIFDVFASESGGGVGRTLVAGLLVGVGTKMANGCTSGHMLLGLARLSKRSLAAVLTFFSVALITARLSPSPHPSQPIFRLSSSTSSPSASALALLLVPLLLSIPSITYSLPILRRRPNAASCLHAFSTGVLFTIGLALAGMTKPSKVLSFFYLPLPTPFPAAPGAWDPSLAMVAIGGLLPNAAVWQSVKGWKKPLRGEKWEVPKGGKVDGKLIVGSALFGVGWGLSGICPGPLFAVLGAGIGGLPVLLFAASMAAGGLAAGGLL
ncbi:hypothetical protein JCM6882_000569 [Rhodosporidiobolus microsporus]